MPTAWPLTTAFVALFVVVALLWRKRVHVVAAGMAAGGAAYAVFLYVLIRDFASGLDGL